MVKNIKNSKIYIGQSKDIEKRWIYHKKRLKYGRHPNKHFQSAWNKYGELNFTLILLEECEKEKMDELEKDWIKKLNACNNKFGYNKTYGGTFGKIHEDSQKNRDEKLRKKTIPEEQREKIRKTLSGRKQPRELVEKRAKSCRKVTDEEENEILALKEKRTPERKIAEIMKLKETTVRSVLNRLWKKEKIMKNKKNVALMGTCNNSKWREELIPLLSIDYFNPVVANWTPECQAAEIEARENSDFVLYVITPKMTGVYSIAEVVDDSNKRPSKTIFCVLPEDEDAIFETHQIKALKATSKLVSGNGAKVFSSLREVADFVNNQ